MIVRSIEVKYSGVELDVSAARPAALATINVDDPMRHIRVRAPPCGDAEGGVLKCYGPAG